MRSFPVRARKTAVRAPAAAAALALTLTGLVTAIPAHADVQDGIEPPESIVDLIEEAHPRLLIDSGRVTDVASLIETDDRLAGWFDHVRADAEEILPTSVSTYTMPGSGNLLQVSREVKRRVYTLGAVYLLTGDTRYSERAIAELLAVADFPDWNPAHFLDVGEMSNAVGIGYDWLYDELSAQERTTIREAVVTHALEPALERYGWENSYFNQPHNWNLVTNGVAIAALAIADEEPALADEVLRHSVRSIQHGIAEYAPDGGYNESPVYWAFGTDYLVTYLAALTSATGTDFGLGDLPGLATTGDFPIHVTGSTGHAFNFGDGGSGLLSSVTSGWGLPVLHWLADRYDNPHQAAWQAVTFADTSPAPMDLFWYDAGATSGEASPESLDSMFDHVEIATARAAWDNPYAPSLLFKGARAGYDQVVAHSNLDAGTVAFDANGVRWFEELGADGYGLPGYFDWREDEGGRWDYYVARPEGQNTFVLGNGLVPSTALTQGADLEVLFSEPSEWAAVADLTTIYGSEVERAERGAWLFDDRRQLLIQDEILAPGGIDYWSFLHTRATVTIADDGRSAILERNGQRLWLELLTPDSELTVGPAGPLPGSPNPAGQSTQNGVQAIRVHLPQITDTTVAIRAVPLAPGQQRPDAAPQIVPLSQWQAAAATAGLASLRVVGGHIDFDPDVHRYDVLIPAGKHQKPPKITVRPDRHTRVEVDQATSLPGVARATVLERSGGRWHPVAAYEVHLHVSGGTGTSWPIAAATASADDGNVAANVIDRHLGTRWSAAGAGVRLDLDLGRRQQVGAVSIAFFNGAARTAYVDIATSLDGRTWRQALSGGTSSAQTDDLEAFGFDPRSARYVRITGNGNSQSAFNSLTEVLVYGDVGAARADIAVAPVGLASATTTAETALSVGSTAVLPLSATLDDGEPADLGRARVSWFSSAPDVASVAADGTVTALAAGRADVAAYVVLDGRFALASAVIDVWDPSTITASADTFVRNGEAVDRNYGQAQVLEVRNNPDQNSGFDRVAYLTFPVSAVDREVSSAVVNLYGWVIDGTSPATNRVHATAPDWDETTTTWNDRPVLGQVLGECEVDAEAGWVSIDITDHVRDAVSRGEDVSIAIVSTSPTYGPLTFVASREANAGRPYLSLEFG